MSTTFVMRNVSVLGPDGRFGDPCDVVVENGVVAKVAHAAVSAGGHDYDLTGLWLMPGIFDCHVHMAWSTTDHLEALRTPITQWCFEAGANFTATLEAGVTGVRDAAGADPGMREAIARGLVAGPRLQVSMNFLSQTGGHGDGFLQGAGMASSATPTWPGKPPEIVDGPDAMRRTVRELLRAGVDWIKVCATGGTFSPHDDPHEPQFSREELDMAVLESRRRGVPVMAHAYGGEGLTDAIAAGVRSIEHGVYLTEEQAAELAARNCFLVPTLAIMHEIVGWAERGEFLPDFAAQKALAHLKPFIGDAVKIASEAGVMIAVGSDYISRIQHGRNLAELSYLCDAGLSAQDVLLAATRNGAELCGVADHLGRIEPGYTFDAIVLGRDPSDMRVFRDPSSVVAVFKGGVLAKGDDLLAARTDGLSGRTFQPA